METTTAAARPLRRDAELNRLRIMAAAREVFAERGLDATLDDIARHAGLGIGTVYRRFPNKEALIDALFEESFAHVLALNEQALENPDAWEGLRTMMTQLAEAQAVDRGLRDVMLSEEYGRDRVAQMRDQIKPLLDRLFARAHEQGVLREDVGSGDLPLLLMMVSSAVEMTKAVDSESWRRYLTILLDGLCRRRDRPTELTEPVLDDDALQHAMHTWPRPRRPVHPAELGPAVDKRSTQA
jgi:AcrR family transcriptional regulator